MENTLQNIYPHLCNHFLSRPFSFCLVVVIHELFCGCRRESKIVLMREAPGPSSLGNPVESGQSGGRLMPDSFGGNPGTRRLPTPAHPRLHQQTNTHTEPTRCNTLSFTHTLAFHPLGSRGNPECVCVCV